MPDCVLANRTDLDRAVDRVLLVFGALSGFAIVKFATTTMTKEPDGPWVLWPLAIALVAFLLRFILGSTIHLNQSFVKGVTQADIQTKWQIVPLFIKDLAFIVAFGLIAVGLTECQSIERFIYWSTVFVALGFAWGVLDLIVRWFLDALSQSAKLEKAWLIIDFLQSLAFVGIFFWPLDHAYKADVFAAVCIICLIADLKYLLTQ